MPPRNSTKNKDVLKELEKTISPVLVVNNSTLKPYVELFEYAPENIYQQPLGNLVGFFEVKEYSEESAYIVNFLTSVLKKEYYINPKRPVTESLDSALHKVNMALSELAKHGNVEWLGKINAAICVLEKNSAHFSVTGNAKIFLYRNQSLSEISEGLATDEIEPHPLKTFVNVSSGRLEKKDRILITSADIFHIFSSLEIKKNFQRFEGEKFVQFLKTALSNQMEMIVSIVIEMKETPAIKAAAAKTKIKKTENTEETLNAFSGKTFAQSTAKSTLVEAADAALDVAKEAAQEIDYTDQKTGHIYVQGQTTASVEKTNAQMALYWDMLKEKVNQSSYATKNELRRRFYLYKKQLAKKRKLRQAEKEKQLALEAEQQKLLEEERAIQEAEHAKQLELERIENEKNLAEEARLEQIRLTEEKNAKEEIAKHAEITQLESQKLEPEIKTTSEEIVSPKIVNNGKGSKKQLSDIKITTKELPIETLSIQQSHELSFLEKLRLAQLEESQSNPDAQPTIEIFENTPEMSHEESNPTLNNSFGLKTQEENNTLSPKFEALKSFAQKSRAKTLAVSQETLAISRNKIEKIKILSKDSKVNQVELANALTPHFSKIGKLYNNLSKQQKKLVFAALVLIFVVPFFIARYLNTPTQITETPRETLPPTQAELLANEKNIQTNTNIQSLYNKSDIMEVLVANDMPVIITKTTAVVLQDNKPQDFALPNEFGTPVRAAFMKDLALVLILSDKNKVLSFSPISTKFTDNKIDLSGISSSSFIGTYLTYLYVLDQKSSQILRFPRAEGGFGDKTNWLKDNTSLANVSDMTIDDNIYALQDDQILKFFKGQKQDFSLETSKTPVKFAKIFTTPDLQNIYVLDTTNSRIVQYSKDGSIVAQYYNEKLKDGSSLAINEQNQTAYVSTAKELFSIKLQ